MAFVSHEAGFFFSRYRLCATVYDKKFIIKWKESWLAIFSVEQSGFFPIIRLRAMHIRFVGRFTVSNLTQSTTQNQKKKKILLFHWTLSCYSVVFSFIELILISHQYKYGFSRSMLTELMGSNRNHVVNVKPFSYGHFASGGNTIP